MVERRLAACAQISEIESFYAWDGAIQHDPEYRILFKTSSARYAELERSIQALHPYDLPAITAIEMTHVLDPYADWVVQNASPV